MRYAQNTNVSTDSSRTEIERTLKKYGATGFMYGWQNTSALIGFDMNGRRIKFILPLPDKTDREITHTARTHVRRSSKQVDSEWEKACRQRWRALALCIKAKLEAVESKITTFEDEFMAHVVLPNGQMVGQWLRPQIEESYKTASMPNLLTGRAE